MFPNAKGSELISVLATIDPASQAAGHCNHWLDFRRQPPQPAGIDSKRRSGTGATLDAKFQQATDASGTGAKDVTGKPSLNRSRLVVACKASHHQPCAPEELDVDERLRLCSPLGDCGCGR
jgi:hypothetical protein